MDDNNYLEEEGRYMPGRPARQQPVVDPDWNGGVAPPPPNGRYDYNNGSPVNSPDEPLLAGNGWVWEGPQTPSWNEGLGQWDRGQWQQRAGQGIGFQAPGGTGGGGGGGGTGGGGGGAVPPISGGSIPSASLPGDVAGLFNQPTTQTPVQSAHQDALLKYLGKAQEPVSLTDSTLAPQVEVFRVQQQRNQERNRRQMAERAAATGQSESGYLDNQINKGLQEQNFNTAAFNANLLGREMGSRREELLAALQLASSTGNAEAERELRNRLAQASASMQQQGLNLQGQLGWGDLALRQWLGQMGSEQFYDQLGVNTGLSLEELNQRAVQRLGL